MKVLGFSGIPLIRGQETEPHSLCACACACAVFLGEACQLTDFHVAAHGYPGLRHLACGDEGAPPSELCKSSVGHGAAAAFTLGSMYVLDGVLTLGIMGANLGSICALDSTCTWLAYLLL